MNKVQAGLISQLRQGNGVSTLSNSLESELKMNLTLMTTEELVNYRQFAYAIWDNSASWEYKDKIVRTYIDLVNSEFSKRGNKRADEISDEEVKALIINKLYSRYDNGNSTVTGEKSEIMKYLKDNYGSTMGGFTFDENQYRIGFLDYNSKGIAFRLGMDKKTINLSWADVGNGMVKVYQKKQSITLVSPIANKIVSSEDKLMTIINPPKRAHGKCIEGQLMFSF